MNEQPGDVLDEAVRLLDALLRRVGGLGDVLGGAPRDGRGDGGDGNGGDGGDVWARVTAEAREEERAQAPHAPHRTPRIATGAPECQDCPVCRAIAVARESGPDVAEHVREAGRSLMAAALDVLAAFERTRGGRTGPDARGSGRGAAADPIDIG
ncbi:hypothetical protein [Actinomadura sp. NBRC 104425]|uniref:hypothetical protein n=1 Tax=Actinomadura sp. NBRC 104425 TaxID=3032204 RepID=UPI0025553EEC|nr:hypothetical protein [Actinomadura sp. NBRC 104425]